MSGCCTGHDVDTRFGRDQYCLRDIRRISDSNCLTRKLPSGGRKGAVAPAPEASAARAYAGNLVGNRVYRTGRGTLRDVVICAGTLDVSSGAQEILASSHHCHDGPVRWTRRSDPGLCRCPIHLYVVLESPRKGPVKTPSRSCAARRSLVPDGTAAVDQAEALPEGWPGQETLPTVLWMNSSSI